MLLTKVRRAVDLRISCYFNGLLKRHTHFFVEDIVMAGPVQKVDDRTSWIGRDPIGVFGLKNMSVDL